MALNIDADNLNADWMRAAVWDLPKDPEVLLFNIGADRWEHFKTLPAFKAIPKGLEAKVDALVRARKPKSAKALLASLVKYDPDQPRDERGRFGSGTGGNGGNGLDHRQAMNLQNQPDKLVKQVYKAEQEHRSVTQREAEKPRMLGRENFETREAYDKAYKEYTKEFKEWSREITRDVISETGEKNLNGTKAGIQNYVNEVTGSDWFVQHFGDGGALGTPQVRLSNASYAGQYSFGIKGNSGYSALSIDSGHSLNEPTIVHELTHYATAISATESHAGHGIEFAENHVFMTSQIFGEDYASGLRDAYVKEGVLNGK